MTSVKISVVYAGIRSLSPHILKVHKSKGKYCIVNRYNVGRHKVNLVNPRKMLYGSRHSYGITLVSEKLLTAEILNGVHISQFIPGFRALGYREHVKDSTSKVRGNS